MLMVDYGGGGAAHSDQGSMNRGEKWFSEKL